MNYRSFPEIFEERVALEPSALAVRDNMLALTYRDLNTRSNEIALYLQSKGVRRGDRVGVLMTRSIKAIAAIIGILKVGAAYVPLDAQDPYPRLKQILAEVDPVLLFTDTETKHSFPDRRLVCFDEMELGQALQGVGNLQLRPKPDDLAYVIYTSGSTGDAKGIAGVHSSITSGMAWVPKDPIREGEVWGLNVSLTFGASIARLFLPLMCGIPLVVFTDEVTKDAQRLLKAVFAERVTNLFLVAPLLQEILRAGQPLTDLLAHVRTVVTGGADRPRNLWQLVNDRIPHIRVIDGYAASEVGSPIIVSMYDWTSKSVVDRIFPGITVRLLDADMKQVPIGGEGEVYVAGQHLARGYWNDLQLTSERFVTLQIEDSPQRLFRTGDRARRTAEDSFELLGRTDLVVKIRGYRVDVTEVEKAIARIEGIKEVAVVPQDFDNSPRLVCFIVAESSREFTTDEVRRHLTVTLPDFMIPARFVFLSRKLPRNMNGKIDRQTLKSHPLPGGAIGVHSVSLQQALVEIVAETLRLGSVSPDHTFLQLGGDSLLSIQVLMHFRQRFGAEIPIQLLLSSKTLADIATELGELPYVQ